MRGEGGRGGGEEGGVGCGVGGSAGGEGVPEGGREREVLLVRGGPPTCLHFLL